MFRSHDQSCGSDAHCGESDACCGSHECGSHSHQGHKECDSFADKLLELADHAWMEAVKGKIIEHILKNHSKHLDELAALVSESNHEKWHKKMAAKHCKESFEEKLKAFFCQACGAQSKSCSNPSNGK